MSGGSRSELCIVGAGAAGLKATIGRERLLLYCARPMFAAERLVWAGEGAQARYRLRGRRCKSTG